jgi:thiol-disulfide isomerase/thioredoxin
MSGLLLGLRALLALVFAVAGVAKLVDRSGSRQAMRAFGVPQRLSAPAAVVIPMAELAVAIALLPLATAVVGAVGAAVLLSAFGLAIAAAMIRREAPECNCFGQLHSSPAGWRTLARNAGLAAVAVFVIVEGRPRAGASAVAWLRGMTAEALAWGVTAIVLGVALVALSWFGYQLLRQNGRILARLDELECRLAGGEAVPPLPESFDWERQAQGLPVGSTAPDFTLDSVDGGPRSLRSFSSAGHPTVLVFSDPGCVPCQAMLPEVAEWQRRSADALTVVMVSRGGVNANRAKAAEHGIRSVVVQRDREVAAAFEAFGTPSAVLISPDWSVASPVAPGAVAIGQLLSRHTAHVPRDNPAPGGVPRSAAPARPAPLGVGSTVPSLILPDLQGKLHDLAERRGSDELLLFWNPSCGFCQKMLADLRAWDASATPDDPELTVISAPGFLDDTGLVGATMLVDVQGEAMALFGAYGTPMAVLVDERRHVSSPVVGGADAVFALAASAHRESAATRAN